MMPVEKAACAADWPTPSCGRIDAPMRKLAEEWASRPCASASVAALSGTRNQTSTAGSPVADTEKMSASPTRRTSSYGARHVATSSQSGWHSHSFDAAPAARATLTVASAAAASFTSRDSSKAVPHSA